MKLYRYTRQNKKLVCQSDTLPDILYRRKYPRHGTYTIVQLDITPENSVNIADIRNQIITKLEYLIQNVSVENYPIDMSLWLQIFDDELDYYVDSNMINFISKDFIQQRHWFLMSDSFDWIFKNVIVDEKIKYIIVPKGVVAS